MVYFILYKLLKMASFFFKTKWVSEASCYAMQRLSTEVGLDLSTRDKEEQTMV